MATRRQWCFIDGGGPSLVGLGGAAQLGFSLRISTLGLPSKLQSLAGGCGGRVGKSEREKSKGRGENWETRDIGL